MISEKLTKDGLVPVELGQYDTKTLLWALQQRSDTFFAVWQDATDSHTMLSGDYMSGLHAVAKIASEMHVIGLQQQVQEIKTKATELGCLSAKMPEPTGGTAWMGAVGPMMTGGRGE